MGKNLNFDDLFKNTVFRPRPERILWESEIIELALYVSKLLSMDIEVEQRPNDLYIELNFDEMPILDDLKLKFLTLLFSAPRWKT